MEDISEDGGSKSLESKLNVLWIRGKCRSAPLFTDEKTLLLHCGSFIKMLSLDKPKEIIFQEPPEGIQCISCDSENGKISLASNRSNIYILRYPDIEVISNWKIHSTENIKELAFVNDCLLSLEVSDTFCLTAWRWQDGQHLVSVSDIDVVNKIDCAMSINPAHKNLVAVHDNECLHVFELEDICKKVKLQKSTVYTPDTRDSVGTSFLTKIGVDELTFFDKLEHNSSGMHSELLDRMPLRVLYPEETDRGIVKIYDKLSQKNRVRISCICWTPDNQVIAACTDGTVFLLAVSPLSVKMVYASSGFASDVNSQISCMALNKAGLFYANNLGVFLVQTVEDWLPVLEFQLDEIPKQMAFSPNYRNLVSFNENGSAHLFELETKNVMYVSTYIDESRIIGIFVSLPLCITARRSGLVEAWNTANGIPAFTFELLENLECMVGIPSSSMLILSSACSYLHVLEFANNNNLRTVDIIKPGKKPVSVIKHDPYCRLAVLLSGDPYIFFNSISPSKGFRILGYFVPDQEIKEIVIFSNDTEKNIFVFLLSCSEDGTRSITKIELPADFVDVANTFWENPSGELKIELLKIQKLDLELYCCSLMPHHTLGLVFYLPDSKELKRIPSENFASLTVDAVKKCSELTEDGQNFRIMLSSNQSMLLIISDRGTISIRDAENFDILSKQKFNFPKNSLPCVAFFESMVFLEGSESEIICYKISDGSKDVELPWTEYLQQHRKIENATLLKMETNESQLSKSWFEEMLHCSNKENIMNFRKEKEKIDAQIQQIEDKLKLLIEDNLAVPEEYQIESENFIFDEDIKEKMLKSRKETIENHTQELQEQLDRRQQDVSDIRKECIESMLVKGEMLESLKDGPILQNYSIPAMSEPEKEQIQHSYKKMFLESCLQNKTSNNYAVFQKLKFEYIQGEDLKLLFNKLQRNLFLLQSIEERVDYVQILKYIVLKKRLHFNQFFDELRSYRKDTVEKIKVINVRLESILLSIGEERQLWRPVEESDRLQFGVSEEEVEDACKTPEKEAEKCIGLAEEVLKEDWLLKRKVSSSTKYQPKLRKEQVEKLKKEAERMFIEVDQKIASYQKRHDKLVEDKLLCDLDINQTELQIFLLTFSVANFRNFRQWEYLVRKKIRKLDKAAEEYDEPIRELEILILDLKGEIENTTKSIQDIDLEVQHVSKLSRNKQGFLEAFDERPEVAVDTAVLNPYKATEIVVLSFDELNSAKKKPPKVPLPQWKQMCTLREQKHQLEGQIKEQSRQLHRLKSKRKDFKLSQESKLEEISEKQRHLEDLHEARIRCNYEAPMVLPVLESQLEIEYPEDLDFRRVLYLRRFHAESMNCLLHNAGDKALEKVQKTAKVQYQIQKNEAVVIRNKLKVRDAKKEIEVIKSIPLTKDVQKIIQQPRGFRLQDKIEAMERSKKLEMDEYARQMDQTNRRISNIEVKKDILKKSLKEKKREIEKLKGDIAELRRIENVRSLPK